MISTVTYHDLHHDPSLSPPWPITISIMTRHYLQHDPSWSPSCYIMISTTTHHDLYHDSSWSPTWPIMTCINTYIPEPKSFWTPSIYFHHKTLFNTLFTKYLTLFPSFFSRWAHPTSGRKSGLSLPVREDIPTQEILAASPEVWMWKTPSVPLSALFIPCKTERTSQVAHWHQAQHYWTFRVNEAWQLS